MKAVNESLPQTDVYMTDGVSLFRVVQRFRSDRGTWAALEDCSTLEVLLCAAADVREAGLELVCRSSAQPDAVGTSF